MIQPTAVVAIGGNALIQDTSAYPDIRQQLAIVRQTASHIAEMVAAGWTVVVTHGNGPQVGYNLRRSELASPEVYPLPFDVIVAQTQGSIGFQLQQALDNEFIQRKLQRTCVALVTQVCVDANDPAFHKPTKPIGGFMNELTAHKLEQEGWTIGYEANRGWRRVVASPEPLAIVEEAAIRQAVAQGWIVIAVGGGGVPVVRDATGELHGVYAVIDKDRASCLLAHCIDADLLLITTGVEKVALHFGKPNQHLLDQMSLTEAEQYMAEGHFPPGSMGPKIEACIRFLRTSRKPEAQALITNPENMARALRGETGTRITATRDS